jgi:hypothetical protein
MQVRDRIKDFRRVRASELRPNAKNWRTHPDEQKDALRGVLAEIGYADALLARELPDGHLELIDGHLRAETTPDAMVPVLVLDVSEAEADVILATLDPLAGLAGRDESALASLLETVETQNEAVQKMLDELGNTDVLAEIDQAAAAAPPEVQIPEAFQVVVQCQDEADQQAVFRQMTEQGYQCRVLTL